LEWIRAHHRASVSSQSYVDRIWGYSEYQSMAVFTGFAGVWCLGGLVYMVGNDLEIYGIWITLLVRLGLRSCFSDILDWDCSDGMGEFTFAGSTGGTMNLLNTVGEMVSRSGNWGAFAFGFIGMIVTGYFAYKLKKPMIQQAIENQRFTATMGGMNTLIEGQAARIVFLEQQLHNKDDYEAILVRRLRECEERHLRFDRGGEEYDTVR
jgi:hypothetical protein